MTDISKLEDQLKGLQQSTRNVHDMLAEAYMHATKLNATDANRAHSEELLHQALSMMADYSMEFFTVMQHTSSMKDNYNAIAKAVMTAIGASDSEITKTSDTAAG